MAADPPSKVLMPRLSWRRWIILAVLSLVGFMVNAATFASLGVVLPAMVRDLSWTWTEAGLGFTILGAACGASSLIPAWMIRRWGVRLTMVVGAVVMALGFAALASAQGLCLYYLGAGLCGVGYQMLALIPGTHVLAALFSRRGMPFGVYFTFAALGGVAGPAMVVAILHVFDDHWRAFWQTQGVIALALGLLCAVAVGGPAWLIAMAERTDVDVAEDIAVHRRDGVFRSPVDWTVRDALRTPQFLVLLAAYFGHLLIGVTVASLSVPHLVQRGVDWSLAAYMLSLEALVQTASRALASLVGDRLEPRLVLIFALAALVIGALALSAAASVPVMLVYAIGSGLGFGLTGLAVPMLLLNYFGRKPNLELFSLTCLVGAVSALGPTLGGVLRDATGAFGVTFQIYAGVVFLILIAAILMRQPKPSQAGDDR